MQAYTCTMPDCNVHLLASQDALYQHELSHNRHPRYCCFCDQVEQEHLLPYHMKSNHGSSFPIDQLNDIVQDCQQVAVPISAWNCPFCDEWAFEIAKTNDTALVPSVEFYDHVGHHLEYICFSSLLFHCSEEDSRAVQDLTTDAYGGSDYHSGAPSEPLSFFQSFQNTPSVDEANQKSENPFRQTSPPPLWYDARMAKSLRKRDDTLRGAITHTGRISRALKGKATHKCDVCGKVSTYLCCNVSVTIFNVYRCILVTNI